MKSEGFIASARKRLNDFTAEHPVVAYGACAAVIAVAFASIGVQLYL